MILSFHPCFEADKNVICAGRRPGSEDLAAIRAAEAVILPQGCYESLYHMARRNCANVFPNYDARFNYPGKTGHIQLFRETDASHPKTDLYADVNDFYGRCGGLPNALSFDFPIVFKFDWGGEGDNVYFIRSPEGLRDILQKADEFERTGQKGFLIQEYIPSQNRALRVVVIGGTFMSYWRIQKDAHRFQANLAKGAFLDHESDPNLQNAAVASAEIFCKKTKINLAGFDFLFSSEVDSGEPLFLEINYFFGRIGLGGSENFYGLLVSEINKWLLGLGLSVSR